MKESVSFSGQVGPEDVRPQPYVYLPFSVPPRTTRIDVSYAYSDPLRGEFGQGSGNTVGIGIFDTGGLGFLEGNGFRGWSGSSRRRFFLSTAEATPGYIPGPIPPGQWHIILGFESILEGGCRYEVQVELTVDEGADEPQGMVASSLARGPAPARGGGWCRGDLHCHTVHSDGLNSVQEMAANALERGLDFLAITEHNTSTHHEELTRLSYPHILLIPGEEITTFWGHANVWGLRQWVDFRATDRQAMRAVARFVLERGGLISVNHPKAVGPPWLFDQGEGYPCMEVWQAPWGWFNWESLEQWDRLLQQGRRIVAVGGSDIHSVPPARAMHPHHLGEPTTWVYVPGPWNQEGLLEAIRQGHVFISENPGGPQLYLTADGEGDGHYEKMMGDAVEARESQPVAFRVHCEGGSGGRLWLVSDGTILEIVPVGSDDFLHEFSLDLSGRTYVRVELRAFRGPPDPPQVVRALTNPIYVNGRKGG